jgi:mono/diheme cytochrome c family protein
VSTARDRRFGRLLPLLFVVVAGCDWNLPGKPDPNKRPVTPDHETDFAALFSRNCAGCHGKDGKAGPAPPLNDDLFRASISEEELMDVIAGGRYVTKQQKTMMPAFARVSGGTLSPAQIQVLVFEIKGTPYKLIKKSGGDEPTYEVKQDPEGKKPAWGTPGRSPQDAPPYTAPPSKAVLTRAKTTFAQHCAGCHGEDGRGGDAGAVSDPAFLALISNQALRRIMITGRPDLEVEGKYMPGYSRDRGREKPLTSQNIDDLVALLAHWRGSGQAASRGR